MIDFNEIPPLQSLPFYTKFHTTASVLRLDAVHPVVTGNKWYKLKHYLQEAQLSGKKEIITFGGAWSNHIVATAAAASLLGLKSTGIIRGEEPRNPGQVLLDAAGYGMQLMFTSREAYREKELPLEIDVLRMQNAVVIPEGGYGPAGARGIEELLQLLPQEFTHILCAVGTGTTLAGIANSGAKNVIGVSVMKNNMDLNVAVARLLKPGITMPEIRHQFHFGGYAKKTEALINFMNAWFADTRIPCDFIYTAKLFYAFDQMAREQFFCPEDNVLLVHTGGLQGNRSLPKGTLNFDP